jgi:outer membrane receptor protein involved in Fe transport
MMADVYYMKKNDFVSPLIAETPLLHLNEADIVTFLTPIVGPGGAAALGAGMAMIPLGVVSSNQVGAQGADLIVSYRNVGDIDLWGADFQIRAKLSDHWEVGGSYSHMSEDYLPVENSSPVALNAPKDKGSLSATFRDVLSGFSASGGVRFTSSFPAQSADFHGTECITGGSGPDFEEKCVDTYAIFNVNAAYEVPNTAATLQLSIDNVLDTGYRSFPGVPKIGRLIMLRARYEIF